MDGACHVVQHPVHQHHTDSGALVTLYFFELLQQSRVGLVRVPHGCVKLSRGCPGRLSHSLLSQTVSSCLKGEESCARCSSRRHARVHARMACEACGAWLVGG